MSESTVKVDDNPQECPKLHWKFKKISDDEVQIIFNKNVYLIEYFD